MFFSNIAIAMLSMYGFTMAFDIPEGQADGIYIATVGTDGNITHDAIPDLSKRDPSVHLDLTARGLPISSSGCSGGFITQYDWSIATQSLASACSPAISVGNKQHAYAISGNAVAFMCNYGGSNPCAASELNDALSAIGKQCLNFQTGWAYSSDWKKSYGFDTTLSSICGNE